MDQAASFARLPAELRTRIYGLALPSGKNFFICEFLHGARKPYPLQAREIIVDQPAWQLREAREGTVHRKFFGQHGLALLRVSKQIYKETMPSVYAENKFTFQTALQLQDFITVIKPGFVHLRDIEFSWLNVDLKTLRVFRDVDTLRTMTLCESHGWRGELTKCMEAMIPGLVAFFPFSKDPHERRRRFDAIQLKMRNSRGEHDVEQSIHGKEILEKLLIKVGCLRPKV